MRRSRCSPISGPATSRVAKSDPRRAALDVVNTLFGGRFTSMLNSELRIRTGLSYGASSHFDRLLQPGTGQMSSFTQTETTIEAIDLALATLDKLHESRARCRRCSTPARATCRASIRWHWKPRRSGPRSSPTLEFYGLDRSYIDG